MGKVKCLRRDLSLKKSIVLHIAVFASLAVLLSIATSALCDHAAEKIRKSYPQTGRDII